MEDLLKKYFSHQEKQKALKLYQDNKVNVSFSKGSLDRFFTASGIIKDDNTYQTTLTYKKNSSPSLTSHCPCPYQKRQEHCHHVAALLMGSLQQKASEKPLLGGVGLGLQSHGVFPKEFGTIMATPQNLEGSSQKAISFNQLRYILTNQKIIQFPILEKIKKEKIRIIFKDSHKKGFHDIRIALVEEDGTLNKKVSLLGHLYLFDWKGGRVFELPTTHQFIFHYFLHNNSLIPIDHYLLKLSSLLDSPLYEFEYKDSLITSSIFQKAILCLNLSPISKTDFELNLFFTNENSQKIALSDFFKIFSFEAGLLSDLSTKKEAYLFIEELLSPSSQKQNSLLKKIPSSIDPLFVDKIQNFLEGKPVPHYEEEEERFYFLPLKKFKKIFAFLSKLLSVEFIRFSSFQPDKRQLCFTISKNKVLEILHPLRDHLSKLQIPFVFNHRKISSWTPKIQLKRNFSNIDWLDISYEISQKDLKMLSQFQSNSDLVISPSGELVLLDREGAQLSKLIQFLKVEGQEVSSNKDRSTYQLLFSRSRIFELFEIYRLNLGDLLTSEEKQICERLESLEKLPSYPLSQGLKKIARHYQKDGYDWLRFLFENRLGACLADEMGLGKTLQTLMFLNELYPEINHVLIVAPVSIISNWANEFKHFTDLPVNIYYGEERTLSPKDENGKPVKISITSYGILKKEFDKELGEINWDILIFDEVQKLKNINSLGSHAARNLKARFRLSLTGTPVENHFGEFHNILDLTLPGIWGERFWRKHKTPSDLSLAKKIVKPFILRRTKKQVLSELPDKIETPVLLSLSENEKSYYHKNLFAIKKAMGEGKNLQHFNILQFILKLRQLCLWQQHPGGDFLSTKIDFLVDNLSQIHEEGHKALIFSQFTSYLDLIQNRLVQEGWKLSRIDGSLSLKKRDAELTSFQKGETDFFLISLKAGGFGLNLTQANYIFLMDPWWNPAVENQAIDRTHRIGQTKNVIVYRPIIKDSIEEKVLLLQDKKRQLFKDLMGSEDSTVYDGRISKDDFVELLT